MIFPFSTKFLRKQDELHCHSYADSWKCKGNTGDDAHFPERQPAIQRHHSRQHSGYKIVFALLVLFLIGLEEGTPYLKSGVKMLEALPATTLSEDSA